LKHYAIVPEYVERFPSHLEEGVFYIAEPFSTAAHLCCCGCGTKIVTPLKPAKWSLTKQGGYISLWPSIGNSNAPCRSHYVIRKNRVEWEGVMTPELTARARARDRADLQAAYKSPPMISWIERLWRWLISQLK
jgi:hypothetical protein